MRSFSIVLVIFILALATNGQTPAGYVVVSVGKQSIKLPTPSGYINAWENYPNLRGAFEINETAGNQMLAMYAPVSAVPGLESGKYLGFPRYFRISVTKSLDAVDISQLQFDQFVDSFEKRVKSVFNGADGPETRKVVADIRRDLRKYFGTDGSFELKEPTYLGTLSRSKDEFRCGTLLTARTLGKDIPVYNTTAVLLLRHRILFVYFYANVAAETDLDAFNAESQKVVDAILVANPVKEKRTIRSR